MTNPHEPSPSVLLADDQELVSSGLRMILERNGLTVVGEACDGTQAIAQTLKLRPDIVLMDVRMPGLDGLEATREILADTRTTSKIIILTTFDIDRYVYAALSAGASGFLLKDTSPELLVASVHLIASGDCLLAPAITRRLIARFARTAPETAIHRDLSKLTPRELEILTLLGKGLSNAQLAAHLSLSEATIKSHVAHVFAKLNLRDRAQAVVLAYETGLVTPGGSA